jgi:hypothetical protein
MRGSTVLRFAGFLVAACGALSLAGCVTPTGFGGPLPVRNQHPAQLVVLRLEPTSAQTLPAGATRVDLSLGYSSLFLRGESATDTFVMDGELLRTALGARVGLTDTLQFDFAIPTLHTTGGFLDHAVQQWHELLDTPESGRDLVPDGAYQIGATRNGQTVFSMRETSLALMDIPLGLTWQLIEPSENYPAALAVRGAVELPTGNAKDGMGNGGFDFALGVVGEVWMGSIALSAHAEYTLTHTPNQARAVGVDYADVGSGGVGLEIALAADTAFLLQLEVDQSVLRNLNDVNTDGTHVMLWLGLRSRLSEDLSMEFSFGEDMTHEVSPDFTVFLGFRLDVGR